VKAGTNFNACLNELARTRPFTDNILPNLHTLDWTGQGLSASMLQFMHSEVKIFSIILNGADEDSVYLPYITTRMPHLHTIHIQHGQLRAPLELAAVFRALKDIRDIHTPMKHLSSDVFEELGKLQHLYKLQVGCGRGDTYSENSLNNISFDKSSFPLLKEMTFTDQLNKLMEPMEIFLASTTLTTITIKSTNHAENPSGVYQVLSTIVKHCQHIEHLDLQFIPYRNISIHDLSIGENCLSLDHLRPFLNLPRLSTFHISHPYPLHLTLDDMEHIAKGCSLIEDLVLNCNPIVTDRHYLPLQAVIPFALHCLKLKRLGLFLKSSLSDLPVDGPRFKYLNTMVLGASQISVGTEYNTIQYLRNLVPSNCHLETPIPHTHSDELQQILSWRVVDRVLSLLPWVI
jgi:hypothetical protein